MRFLSRVILKTAFYLGAAKKIKADYIVSKKCGRFCLLIFSAYTRQVFLGMESEQNLVYEKVELRSIMLRRGAAKLKVG